MSHLEKFAMENREVKAPNVARKWMSARLSSKVESKMN
jgi:hypothetical protein